MTSRFVDVERAREWLSEHCHHADVHHTLQRAIEYVEAVERAGLSLDGTAGDDLYAFLSDPNATGARARSFVQPTL
jgi:hypothetical protein